MGRVSHMITQEQIVFLNKQYLPIGQANVSVLDRGFLFGDGIYEVIPVFGSKPLREDEHLSRLDNSLRRVGMDNPYQRSEWQQLFQVIIEKNPGEDRAIYLQITRGHYDVRDLSVPEKQELTVFVMVMHVNPVDISVIEKGLRAVTVDDFRWHACDIKSISLMANVMLKQKAIEAGVDDALLVRDGNATEGTASNLFIVKDRVLVTPPKSNLLLPGITRDLVVELAEKNNIRCEMRDIAKHELSLADEIWLTSSTREIAPIVELDGNPVGDGKAGDCWRSLMNYYQLYKKDLREGKV